MIALLIAYARHKLRPVLRDAAAIEARVVELERAGTPKPWDVAADEYFEKRLPTAIAHTSTLSAGEFERIAEAQRKRVRAKKDRGST